jgi:hypothetical protein
VRDDILWGGARYTPSEDDETGEVVAVCPSWRSDGPAARRVTGERPFLLWHGVKTV